MIRWRRSEIDDEFHCTKSVPKSHMPLIGLLKYASEIYMETLFRDFEKEFTHAMGTVVSQVHEPGTHGNKYQVTFPSIEQSTHEVTYNVEAITCSCKTFEESGWLCYHIIRVLHFFSIVRIPEQYIKSRWTKFAKKDVWDRVDAESKELGLISSYTPWRHQMARKFYNLILNFHTNEDDKSCLEEKYKLMVADTNALLTKPVEVANAIDAETADVLPKPSVRDPNVLKTKGSSGKRINGAYDHYKRGSKNKKGKGKAHEEFGSKTPNVRLI
ncbi:unnamed protein product [Amaranthus hypochondriacus]